MKALKRKTCAFLTNIKAEFSKNSKAITALSIFIVFCLIFFTGLCFFYIQLSAIHK
jgi:hypothetical protein